jgi:hypothetical protein
MGYEVLTAFFLEAGFLGIMLFGRPWQVRDGGSPGLRGARHPQAQLAASKTSSVAVASQAASASLTPILDKRMCERAGFWWLWAGCP